MSMSKGPPVCGRGLSSCMSMSKGPFVRPFCLYLFGLGIIPCHMFHKSVFMIKRTMSSFMILPAHPARVTLVNATRVGVVARVSISPAFPGLASCKLCFGDRALAQLPCVWLLPNDAARATRGGFG